MENTKVTFLKNLYLYLVSFVALMMVVFSTADLINTALRTYVFKLADRNYYSYPTAPCPVETTTTTTGEKFPPCVTSKEQKKMDDMNAAAQRQRDLVRDISMIIVGIPLFIYHWRLTRKNDV